MNTSGRVDAHIKVWRTQGNQSQQLLRDGEVDMMVMWNARASERQQQGHPVELVWLAGRTPPSHLGPRCRSTRGCC